MSQAQAIQEGIAAKSSAHKKRTFDSISNAQLKKLKLPKPPALPDPPDDHDPLIEQAREMFDELAQSLEQFDHSCDENEEKSSGSRVHVVSCTYLIIR